MPAPAAPPPVKATPSPAAPVPSSPAPSPAPEPSKPEPESTSDSPFAELDKAWKEVETAPKSGQPEPTQKPDKPETPQKPEPAATPEKTKPFNAPKEMRDHMAKLEGDLKSRDAEMGKLKGQLNALEGKAKEHGTLIERITSLEKELDDRQAQIRALKQEQSPEFIKQYDKPFRAAADYAKSIVEDLAIVNGEGQTRPAKWDDFVALYNLPPGKANKAARELFGDDASTVINHLQELHRLDYNKKLALTEEMENAKKRTAEEEANSVRQREQVKEKWIEVNRDLAENVEEYHDAPEEHEAAQVRTKALAIYDSQPKSMNEKIVKDAHIRHIVGAHPVLKRKVKLLATQLAEAQKELESFKHPQPKGGKRTGAPAGAPEKEWAEELREAVT